MTNSSASSISVRLFATSLYAGSSLLTRIATGAGAGATTGSAGAMTARGGIRSCCGATIARSGLYGSGSGTLVQALSASTANRNAKHHLNGGARWGRVLPAHAVDPASMQTPRTANPLPLNSIPAMPVYQREISFQAYGSLLAKPHLQTRSNPWYDWSCGQAVDINSHDYGKPKNKLRKVCA